MVPQVNGQARGMEVSKKTGPASWRGMAVENLPPVVYPRDLPANRKESFLKIHEMLCQEILDDISENVRASLES